MLPEPGLAAPDSFFRVDADRDRFSILSASLRTRDVEAVTSGASEALRCEALDFFLLTLTGVVVVIGSVVTGSLMAFNKVPITLRTQSAWPCGCDEGVHFGILEPNYEVSRRDQSESTSGPKLASYGSTPFFVVQSVPPWLRMW